MTILTTIPNGASGKDIRDTLNAMLSTVASLPPPAFATAPSISPAGGAIGTTFTANDGLVTNGLFVSRRWLLGGSAIGTGTTIAPGTTGSLVLETTATNPIGGKTTVVTSAAVTVGAATQPVSISGTPGGATQNAAYSFAPTTANGSGTKTFSLTGTLPAGLTFSTTTGAITGTPTTAGTTSGLNITVTDSTGSASLGTFSIVVTAQAASPFFGSTTSTWDNTSPTFGATA
jgi:hypothetical protein